MKRPSVRIRSGVIKARGLNKAVALILLFPLAFAELIVGIQLILFGMHSVSLMLFILFIWNLGFTIGLTIYILSYDQEQTGGYVDSSNYANLNKIGRGKY